MSSARVWVIIFLQHFLSTLSDKERPFPWGLFGVLGSSPISSLGFQSSSMVFFPFWFDEGKIYELEMWTQMELGAIGRCLGKGPSSPWF